MSAALPLEAGWQLAWADEFDGPAVDESKWSFELGNGFFHGPENTWVPGWGNRELQCYTREAATVSDSLLRITARREPRAGFEYTSARLRTRSPAGPALFAQRYGRFEVRARAPVGRGLWAAFWLLPQDNRYGPWPASGEIDLMETVGDRAGEYLASLHFGSSHPANASVTHRHAFAAGESIADFHVYALEWAPGEIRWSVDGQAWARSSDWWSCSLARDGRGIAPARAADLNAWPAPFDQPFHLVVNLAVGGELPGSPDGGTAFPAEFAIDYVRVYTRTDGYPAAPPPTAVTNAPGRTPRTG